MNKARLDIAPGKLVINDGRIDWLPRNPRKWTAADIDKTVASIERDPDFMEDRPILVLPLEGGKYLVFCHNLLTTGAKRLKLKTVPCVVYFPETDEDRETVKRRAILDNGSFGSHDFDALANEWDDLPLLDLGVPAWEPEQPEVPRLNLSTEGREGAEGYDEFVDKFKPKLTTDDCYTPADVYDIIRNFVDQKVTPLKGRQIVRPFVPGGDYEHFDYPEGCVVLDNPPFSLYSKIVRFYIERGIDFFLFGPSLTLFVSNADACFIVAHIPIRYENGAVVSTGFVTNMVPGIRIWVEHSMRDAVIEAQKDDTADLAAYELPDEVVTSARLGKIASRGADLKLAAKDCFYIHDLDGMKEAGKGLYGGGICYQQQQQQQQQQQPKP